MSRPLRSLLFIPGDSDRKLAKVAGCGADAVILDLEDAVAPDAKEGARVAACAAAASGDYGDREVTIRVNPLNPGSQVTSIGAAHISFVAYATNPTVVYIGGDTQPHALGLHLVV